MERIVLRDVCDIIDGPHATPTKTESGPVYLGIDAITEDGRLNEADFAHLSVEDYKKWTRRVTPTEGDIVFSYEATLGRYAVIPKGFYGCLGRRLAVIRNRSEAINTKWLYYYFRSPEWDAFIRRNTIKGSTVNRISVEDFPNYTIPAVKREQQDRIAGILGAIDKKISTNNAINDNLAQQLRLLYDYWFTQFDFPDESGNPYRSSGGQMVWNNGLKRKIPESWCVVPLGEVSSFRNGINYDKNTTGDTTYHIVNVRNISSSSILLDERELDEICLPCTQAEKYLVSNESILIARSGIPGAPRILYNPSKDIIFCGFIICATPIDSILQHYLMLF